MSNMAGGLARVMWGNPSADVKPPTEQANAAIASTTPTVSNNLLYGLQDGMTQQDNGNGSYGILWNGQNIGTGYSGVRDAYNTLAYTNAQKNSAQTGDYWSNPLLKSAQMMWSGFGEMGLGPQVNDSDLADEQRQKISQSQGIESGYYAQEQQLPTRFKSQDELNNALQSYVKGQNFYNEMGNWEALGQAIHGGIASNTVIGGEGEFSKNPVNGLGETALIPANGRDEVISGTNALYGSSPVFEKDASGNYKLVGYRTDLLPGTTEDQTVTENQVNNEQYGSFITHNDSSRAYSVNNWRELDPASISGNAVMGADGSAFVPLENADKLKWTNKEASKYVETNKNDHTFFGDIFDQLDPVLDDVDPGHEYVQNAVKDLLGKDTQKETFETVAPIVLAIVASVLTAGAASGAAGAAGGAAEGAAAGASAGTAVGATSGAVAGTAATGLTTGQMIGWGAAGLNAANSLGKGDYLGATLGLLGTGLSSGAFDGALSSISSGASDIATAAGIGSETQGAISGVAKGFMNGDLRAMTAGAINLPDTANKIIGTAVSNAVKSAALAGATGAELENVMKTAIISGMASLVGTSVSQFSGNSTAGAIGGAVTSGALNLANNQNGGSTATPAATDNTPKDTQSTTSPNYFAGKLARLNWS